MSYGTVQFGQRNWEPVMITADWTSPRRPAAITWDAASTSATVPRTMSPSPEPDPEPFEPDLPPDLLLDAFFSAISIPRRPPVG